MPSSPWVPWEPWARHCDPHLYYLYRALYDKDPECARAVAAVLERRHAAANGRPQQSEECLSVGDQRQIDLSA